MFNKQEWEMKRKILFKVSTIFMTARHESHCSPFFFQCFTVLLPMRMVPLNMFLLFPSLACGQSKFTSSQLDFQVCRLHWMSPIVKINALFFIHEENCLLVKMMADTVQCHSHCCAISPFQSCN